MKLFFDLLITIGLVMTALPAVILLYSRQKRETSWEYTHRQASLLLSIILLIGTTLLIWGSFIEPNILVVQKQTIDVDNINTPVMIAFVADFQVGKYKRSDWVTKVVETIEAYNPDIILLGGDQVDNATYDLKESHYLKPLETFAQRIPIYTIHGNHEYGISCDHGIYEECHRLGDASIETKQELESMGITYLENELKEITIGDTSFYLFGGDSYWAQKLDFSSLSGRNKDIPTIALIHNPSFLFDTNLDIHSLNLDLVLSGHTHGGQVRLPFIGPIGLVDNLLPHIYYKGYHELDTGEKLYVTSGVGETGARARLFNPPEIVILTLE